MLKSIWLPLIAILVSGCGAETQSSDASAGKSANVEQGLLSSVQLEQDNQRLAFEAKADAVFGLRHKERISLEAMEKTGLSLHVSGTVVSNNSQSITEIICRSLVISTQKNWASSWATISVTNGRAHLPLKHSLMQVALNRASPYRTVRVECRGGARTAIKESLLSLDVVTELPAPALETRHEGANCFVRFRPGGDVPSVLSFQNSVNLLLPGTSTNWIEIPCHEKQTYRWGPDDLKCMDSSNCSDQVAAAESRWLRESSFEVQN